MTKDSTKKVLKMLLLTSSFSLILGISIIGSHIIALMLNIAWGTLFFMVFFLYSTIYLVKYKNAKDNKKIADATLAIIIELTAVVALTIFSIFVLKNTSSFMNVKITWSLFIITQIVIFKVLPANDYVEFKKLDFNKSLKKNAN